MIIPTTRQECEEADCTECVYIDRWGLNPCKQVIDFETYTTLF